MAPCGIATSKVTVILNHFPNAGVAKNTVSVCSNQKTLDLITLLDGVQDTSGIWTNATGQVITSPIIITDFITGSYSYTYTLTNSCGVDSELVQFIVNKSPTIKTNSVLVTTPICLNDSVVVTITNLENVPHTIIYDLTGSNSVANQTVLVTPVNGRANFTLSALELVNPGITTITIKQISTTIANCLTILSNVSSTIVVNPIPIITANNLISPPICVGNSGVISISNPLGLIDGDYIFNYTISYQGTTVALVSNPITIKSGLGQIPISATNLPNAGMYLIEIQKISNVASGCSSDGLVISTSIEVQSLPNTNGLTIEAFDVCIGDSNELFIKNATNLQDGDYWFTYQLTGSLVNESTVVKIISGSGSFIIPAIKLTTIGSVRLELISVGTPIALCTTTTSNLSLVFNVNDSATPTILNGGNVFCQNSNSTLADLTLAIVEPLPIFWYATPQSIDPLDPSTILVSGATYYATAVSSNRCESAIRLAVTISFKDCIVIPDGFSPNNDGINDTFYVKDLADYYPNFTMEIFNRYGSSVFSGNRNSPHWNGKASIGVRLNSEELPVGVYYYIISFNDGKKESQQGRLYLSR